MPSLPGQFALHPYAREYIYDVTGRLGLPPLTVGVLTMPYDEVGLPHHANRAIAQARKGGEETMDPFVATIAKQGAVLAIGVGALVFAVFS